MGVRAAVAVGATGVAAGLVARSLVRQRHEGDADGRHPEGWKAVTVLGDSDAFAVGGYPEPLRRIADAVEVRIEQAPGDKGFEVHARVREGADTRKAIGDDDPDQRLRAALRDAKQLFETGEVLLAAPRPHGRRPRTLLGAVVDEAEAERCEGRGCAVRALCWTGVNDLAVETVDDPAILNAQDIIVRVILSTTCGSDLHLLGGYVPTMRAGDVLGHEFLGEVVETGSAVTKHAIGDRVVVCSFISCGTCWYCRHELYSLCDNGNPNAGIPEALWGQAPGGCYGYSHALGGWAGSHAQYIRVPYADQGAFAVPDGVSDERALFASDAAPTGWMGADLGGVRPGDTVAVWGAGGVGQMAARAAMLLGAERVVVIDRYQERLDQVERVIGAETMNYETSEVLAELRELTGGRGPDVCIEAVGMEAHENRVDFAYDQLKQQLRLQTDRPTAVREAIMAARKGGSVFVLGVFGGVVDKFPLGAVMNKGLTLRSAQQHGQRYIPMLLERMARDELTTEHLATHVMPLEEGPEGYAMFKKKDDGCVRAVFRP